MKKLLRKPLATLAVLSAFLLLLLVPAVSFLRSEYFRHHLHERVVSLLEDVIGGRVEVGALHYSWLPLSVSLEDVVIHGTESSTSPPLFAAASVVVYPKLRSLLGPKLDVDSLAIGQPRIYLAVRPDGSTNLPVANQSPVQTLLNLHIRALRLNHGLLAINDTRVPLDLQAHNLQVLLASDLRAPRYNVQLSIGGVHVNNACCSKILPGVTLAAQLGVDRLSVSRLLLSLGNSHLQAQGELAHFAHPQAAFTFSSSLSAAEAAAFAGSRALQAGELTLSGSFHFHPATGIQSDGSLTFRALAGRLANASLSNLNGRLDFHVANNRLSLQQLSATSESLRFNGAFSLENWRAWQASGHLNGLTVARLAALLNRKTVPYTGLLAGPIQLSGELTPNTNTRQRPAFAMQGRLEVSPLPGPIPISGVLDFTRSQDSFLTFNSSFLNAPHSHLTFSGVPGQTIQVTLETSSASDLAPLLTLRGIQFQPETSASFDGTVSGDLSIPSVTGSLKATHFVFADQIIDALHARLAASPHDLDWQSATLQSGPLLLSGSGHLALDDWYISSQSPLRIKGQLRNLDLARALPRLTWIHLPLTGGIADATLDAAGTVGAPTGIGSISVRDLVLQGEPIRRLQSPLQFKNGQLLFTAGRLESAAGSLKFHASYDHAPDLWTKGKLTLDLASTGGLQVEKINLIRQTLPGLSASLELRGSSTLRIEPNEIALSGVNGDLVARGIVARDQPVGDISATFATLQNTIHAKLNGDVRASRLQGSADVQLAPGNPVSAQLQFDQLSLNTISGLFAASHAPIPFTGTARGSVDLHGSLADLTAARAAIQLDDVRLESSLFLTTQDAKLPQVHLQNTQPIRLELAGGTARINSLQLAGNDTNLSLAGSFGFLPGSALNLKAAGSLNLAIFQLLDPNVKSSGESLLNASLTGSFAKPALQGTLDINNGSFFSPTLPNGLSAVNGRLNFDGQRATIQKLNAQTGGGQLALTGFIAFSTPGPVIYHLEAHAEDVRVRSASGISVTANSDLRLTGTSASSLLSGAVTVSRVVFNPNTDVGNVLAAFAEPTPAPANQKDFLSGLHLDIGIDSAPNLQLSTALSRDVEAEVDLRLRGTPDRPILVGSVSANQGDIRVFGTRYTLNRGEIRFVNTIKIEPILDLDLQTEARGIVVDITISGAPSKLNIAYRSDPPLQPRDIIALLTVGRSPGSASNVQNVQIANDTSALQSGANTVLGQAISPVSNRLSKLFGITNVKIDPLVQGIANTPQARLTLEEQVSRNLTVTYITNLSQTSEQIFRVEWALGRQYSIVALRDENGEFGIDIQYRRRFR